MEVWVWAFDGGDGVVFVMIGFEIVVRVGMSFRGNCVVGMLGGYIFSSPPSSRIE